jgi:hypothetical protein
MKVNEAKKKYIFMTKNGKIARLPQPSREPITRRLHTGGGAPHASGERASRFRIGMRRAAPRGPLQPHGHSPASAWPVRGAKRILTMDR